MIKNTRFFFLLYSFSSGKKYENPALVVSLSMWWLTELGIIIPGNEFRLFLLTLWYSTLVIAFPCLWWPNSSPGPLRTFVSCPWPTYVILSDFWCFLKMCFSLPVSRATPLPTISTVFVLAPLRNLGTSPNWVCSVVQWRVRQMNVFQVQLFS